jgi:peptide/nickel transport system ATP-binding protein
MGHLLEVRNLSIEFLGGDAPPHRAVDGVSFDIAAGEVVGLMGESGCGKTSTALALLGLLPKSSARVRGSALFRGKELLSLRDCEFQRIRGAEISLVFQEPEIALSPVMRAGDQVTEVFRAHRDWPRKRCRSEARRALAGVGLSADRFFAAYPHQLSGGERQRVVLAQALACGPALLIADEPTASLDARAQANLLSVLRSLKDQRGLAVLLISHSAEVQASLADRLLIMKDGQIIEQGAFASVHAQPAHPYTQSLWRAKRLPLSPATQTAGESHSAARELVHIP